jgi:hypothetical protein
VIADLPRAAGRRNATLTYALVEIGIRAGRDVVFIIDAAQQALMTEAGKDAMFALKAARDAMNQRREGARLYLLFAGSHRDKLAALVLTHKQPFYGARVQDFPSLDATSSRSVCGASTRVLRRTTSWTATMARAALAAARIGLRPTKSAAKRGPAAADREWPGLRAFRGAHPRADRRGSGGRR